MKLTTKGLIERAVVYGLDGRDMKMEKTLADGKQTVEGLARTIQGENWT